MIVTHRLISLEAERHGESVLVYRPVSVWVPPTHRAFAARVGSDLGMDGSPVRDT